MKKSEGEVAQLCPTLSNPMDCILPGSSVHGIFQARVLEWGAIAFPKKLYRTSQNMRRINAFLESLLSESFPSLGVPVQLASLGCPPTLCWSLDPLWGSSESHLVPLLCVLASTAHGCQNERAFFCGRSQWPLIESIDPVCPVIEPAACPAGGKVLGLLP